jgi:hypothetical protein
LQAVREVIAEASAAGEAIDPAPWPGCKTVGYVVSQRAVKGAPAKAEERYSISSRELSAQQLGQAVRTHWGIENRLHWMLGCVLWRGRLLRQKGQCATEPVPAQEDGAQHRPRRHFRAAQNEHAPQAKTGGLERQRADANA